MTKASERKIFAFERKCYIQITQIGWSQKITKKELCIKCSQKEIYL